ncbi:hypothetical protein ACG9X2_14035 [Acinetobacter bereziniae]|uniref:hypothetical protein n=1 Tax=Acinetobacter bereziniae TaxID=106648 RepID=UPI003AF77857
MKVTTDLTNDELEKLYEQINSKTINLPINFKKLRLGLLARICQIFITSLKYNPDKIIKFYQFDSTYKENSIDEFLEHPECLTALLMSNNVYEKDKVIDGKKENVELKSKINRKIQDRLNQSILEQNHRVQMFAVDHSIKKYAFPSCFYFPEGSNTLASSDFYATLLNRVIHRFHPKTEISIEEINSLALAIHELIENTEQHGKSEFNTGKVKRSVRALIIDYKRINRSDEIETISGFNTPMTDYLNNIKSNKGTLHFLEISIFDSGEGIFKTLKANSDYKFEIRDEVKVVEEAFAKGKTSKSEFQGYGRGLHNVRTILDKRSGFLSLRTGHISLFRDFKINRLTEAENIPLELYDEITKSRDEYKKLAHAEGLAISILVPLR